MSQINRIGGGQIDRSQSIQFSFNGQSFQGYAGDTLASALLANGQRFVARSFKYHRPRGIFSAGSEEPNALVQLRQGAFQEPNSRATVIELYQGLSATSQNHLGSLKYDLMEINDFLAPLLTAGFYYKTFMWPKSFWEKIYEPIIRNSAGLGKLSTQADPDCYDKGFLHCDLLVIGAGPTGLAAALTAAKAGGKVLLADEDYRFGGRLNAETFSVAGQTGVDWAIDIVAQLKLLPNVRLLKRTTVFGAYDHGNYGALQRCTDHLAEATDKPRQILWRIYSKRALLCTGATERPIGFANNDRPGIMLAGAVRAYVNRWGVTPGKNVTVLTNNDDGWRTASDLLAKGVTIAAIIDTRDQAPLLQLATVAVYCGDHIVDSSGRKGLRSITLASGERIATDCLAIAGGWNPNLQLTCHQRSRPQWSQQLAAFVPGEKLPAGMSVAGAAQGNFGLASCLQDGHGSANRLIAELGFTAQPSGAPTAEDEASAISAFWYVKNTKHRVWLDLQNDVTVKDVMPAHQEGFTSVEHLKRYTTLGMATDQGKTSNVNALAVMADCTGRSIEESGTTIFRPPYTPVPIGALAGRARGSNFRPIRLTPSHSWAEQHGAVFVETGMWLRAQWFAQPGESHWRQSVDREVNQTRASVGICDVTTLGKIDVQGRDAADFLNRVYINSFAKLAVGKVRYGLMLREDGIAMDDGTTARLAEHHFVMTTTTANAGAVYRHLEFCRQCLWPGLDVQLVSTTEQFAQYAIAGPQSRALLQKIVDPQFAIDNQNFAFMACADITICGGTPARLFRISFSGELAFELAVATRYGDALFKALIEAGQEFNVTPYGTEALGVMRIEKGHAAGNEINGQITALNLGMGAMLSKKKDCIGNKLSERSGLNQSDALALVGFKAVRSSEQLQAGAHFVDIGEQVQTSNDQGWMSSAAFSPTLGHSIGLGFITNGTGRLGETVRAVDLVRGKDIEVEIVSPHFVDPEGVRLRV